LNILIYFGSLINEIINSEMKTKILKSGLLVLLSIFSIAGFGQEAKKIYDPSLDGMKQINNAVTAATIPAKPKEQVKK
jgi:hypothetical protein